MQKFKEFINKSKELMLKPRLLYLAPKPDEEITLKPVQIIARIFVMIITAAWISFMPLYLFVIYMHQNKFFSYDFFVDGVFGLNTFAVATAILLTSMSLYLYGFILFAKLGIQDKKYNGKNRYRTITWIFLLVSVLMHYFLLRISISENKPYLILWVIEISVIFCTFFYSLVGHGLKRNIQNWVSPILFICASIILPFTNQDATSEVVSMILRNFNMGGGQNIQIEERQNNNKELLDGAGKLILLTPKNAYIRNDEGKLLILPISDHTEVKIW